MTGAARCRRAFTLIEVLIATTIFVSLISVFTSVFHNVLILEEEVRAQRSFNSIGPAVLDLMEDDLQSLYTHPLQPDAFPFRGDDESMAGKPADTLAFVARRASIRQEELGGAGQFVRSPINEVGYRLARGDRDLGDVRRLYRREAYYVDASPLQGGDYFEVYDRVVALDIRYAGFQVEESERETQEGLGRHRLERFDSWDSDERRGLPTAVIVTLEVAPPTLGSRAPGDLEDLKTTRFVRIVPLLQADDIPPQQPAAGPGSGR
ncbi:MAG: type II secretion system protein J [Planctomycetota bacterium]